ncbi:MAG: ABC transporter substrate-binding protein [Bacillota bacterium]
MNKYRNFILILLLMTLIISGCNQNNKDSRDSVSKLIIAEQYGLAYAPVTIMKEMGYLDDQNNNIIVEWKKLSNTAAIRESMLAGDVDIGFMALPPFLIGSDKGMDWKIISGLSQSPVELMTNNEEIKSIKDLKKEDKIALPQPGSIQHILLSMAAEKEFGEADRFDNQLLSMNHPDGMNALLAKKEITAHFTSPPYIFMESKEDGINSILNGRDAVGEDFTFIAGVGTREFYENQDLYNSFKKALDKSIQFINENPEKSAEILSNYYELDQQSIIEYLNWEGMEYSSQIKALDKFISFMNENDYINIENYSIDDFIWEGTEYEE